MKANHGLDKNILKQVNQLNYAVLEQKQNLMILPPTCIRDGVENNEFEEEKKEARMRYSMGFKDIKQDDESTLVGDAGNSVIQND